MKQTAVEWLVEQLGEIRFISYAANCTIERGKLKEYIAKAKAMEKEQIEEAYGIGYTNCEVGIKYRKQYYNETFNQ